MICRNYFRTWGLQWVCLINSPFLNERHRNLNVYLSSDIYSMSKARPGPKFVHHPFSQMNCHMQINMWYSIQYNTIQKKLFNFTFPCIITRISKTASSNAVSFEAQEITIVLCCWRFIHVHTECR